MSITEDTIDWIPIPHWHKPQTSFIGWSEAPGLFRARLRGETVFLGHAAKGDLGGRLRAYRRLKSANTHYAGRLIYEHRTDITMQIVVMRVPEGEILKLLDKLLRERRPPWNVPGGHYRDI